VLFDATVCKSTGLAKLPLASDNCALKVADGKLLEAEYVKGTDIPEAPVQKVEPEIELVEIELETTVIVTSLLVITVLHGVP
jgi:hypothetical protein